MSSMEEVTYYHKALKKWGEDAQLAQLLEEMLEAGAQILRLKRTNRTVCWDDVAKELADVKQLIAQVELIVVNPNETLGDLIGYAQIESFQKFKRLVDEHEIKKKN